MKKYDIKSVGMIDFIYIGNDVNGNCKYAVNFRCFLNDVPEECEKSSFEERRELAWLRAKKCGFEREINRLEPYFTIRPCGNFAELVTKINYAKSWVHLKKPSWLATKKEL